MEDQFERDVLEGLTSEPKRLPSRYFYDQKGDALFQEIMELDEYYLTRSEYEVLVENRERLYGSLSEPGGAFNLLEFGAGDGYKTRVLLHHFLEMGSDFTYCPIDISRNALDGLSGALVSEMPDLKVNGICGEYFQALASLENEHKRSVVLFLGSNIGNFEDERAIHFLKELNDALHPGDMVLIGFDLRKDPLRILNAYNDAKGVTAEFNLNLLDRINRELGADFDRSGFMHYPIYDPVSGQARSYLMSNRDQQVEVAGRKISFKAWEPIHTEISRKFYPDETDRLARSSGFTVVEQFFDQNRNFLDALWKK